jgi:hypothetical protein
VTAKTHALSVIAYVFTLMNEFQHNKWQLLLQYAAFFKLYIPSRVRRHNFRFAAAQQINALILYTMNECCMHSQIFSFIPF